MPQLRASAGKIDLEPRVGQWLTGYASRIEPAHGIHDPVMARAVVLDNGETSLVIVALDLLGLGAEYVKDIRQRIERQTSIPSGHVLISCTHTHFGPAAVAMRGVMSHIDYDWLERLKSRIVDLVDGLVSDLRPARIGHASTTVTGVAFNRQDKTHPHDEELVVIAIDSESGEPIATIANYATHAVVLGGRYMFFSADFPGELNRRVEEARGGVSLYLQGGCGDVNPDVEVRGRFEDCERIGEMLARAVLAAVADAPRTSDVSLGAASKVVGVPLDPAPTLEQVDEQIAQFEANKRKAADSGNRERELVDQTMLDWVTELRGLIIRDAVPKTLPAEVFAARINDLRIVTLPFETYNDIGVAIKQGVKPLRGVFVGYSNGLFGYCPTRWAKDQGGYGPVDSVCWFGELLTPIGYGADELLIREGIALAKSL
jgi:neutral ceramidase